MAHSIALTRTSSGFWAALVTRGGSTIVRIRRGLQTLRCTVVTPIALPATGSGLRALPGLAGPIVLVSDSRARVGERSHRRMSALAPNCWKIIFTLEIRATACIIKELVACIIRQQMPMPLFLRELRSLFYFWR